jgi:hypothetical protein
MSEFLKFTCPKCGGHEIECVQVNATVTQKLRIPAGEKGFTYEWYGEPDVDDSDALIEEYRCATPMCHYVLPVESFEWDHYGLRAYLASLPENQEASK